MMRLNFCIVLYILIRHDIVKSQNAQDEPLVDAKTRISETKCKQYSDAFSKSISFSPLLYAQTVTTITLEECGKSGSEFIVGGEEAEAAEFPHMAAIGWQLDEELLWQCGGSIISERFVLTAAHCREFNRVKPSLIRCGSLKLSAPDSSYMDFKIESVITAPAYTVRFKYDDIALIHIDGIFSFSKFIRPACLWTNPEVNTSTAVATGFGLTAFDGQKSDHLMKVELNMFDNSVCDAAYSDSTHKRRLNRGIIESQLCAGDLSGKRDTCQGDSGAGLQIKLPGRPCTHYLIGVTSFGKSCALAGSPGVYTRVSSYLDWVEKLVWNS